MQIKDHSKILLFFPAGIGDVVRNLGIVNAIKLNAPTAILDVAYVKEGTEQILKFNKHIRKAIPLQLSRYTIAKYVKYFLWTGWKDIVNINQEKYDIVIATTMNPQRKLLTSFIKTHHKILLHRSGSNAIEEYRILENMGINSTSEEKLLNANKKIESIEPSEVIRQSLSVSKKNIIINMFCADSPGSSRDWDKWGSLIDRLCVDNNVILVGKAKFDYEYEYRIDYSTINNLINKTNIDELLYLINKGDAVITIDTSIFHISYALNKEVIGLFGPVDPAIRIPPAIDKSNIKVIYKKSKCAPCITNRNVIKCRKMDNPNICMNNISVDDVLNKLKIVLQSQL